MVTLLKNIGKDVSERPFVHLKLLDQKEGERIGPHSLAPAVWENFIVPKTDEINLFTKAHINLTPNMTVLTPIIEILIHDNNKELIFEKEIMMEVVCGSLNSAEVSTSKFRINLSELNWRCKKIPTASIRWISDQNHKDFFKDIIKKV